MSNTLGKTAGIPKGMKKALSNSMNKLDLHYGSVGNRPDNKLGVGLSGLQKRVLANSYGKRAAKSADKFSKTNAISSGKEARSTSRKASEYISGKNLKNKLDDKSGSKFSNKQNPHQVIKENSSGRKKVLMKRRSDTLADEKAW